MTGLKNKFGAQLTTPLNYDETTLYCHIPLTLEQFDSYKANPLVSSHPKAEGKKDAERLGEICFPEYWNGAP